VGRAADDAFDVNEHVRFPTRASNNNGAAAFRRET
jgi:hypothetical protein